MLQQCFTTVNAFGNPIFSMGPPILVCTFMLQILQTKTICHNYVIEWNKNFWSNDYLVLIWKNFYRDNNWANHFVVLHSRPCPQQTTCFSFSQVWCVFFTFSADRKIIHQMIVWGCIYFCQRLIKISIKLDGCLIWAENQFKLEGWQIWQSICFYYITIKHPLGPAAVSARCM